MKTRKRTERAAASLLFLFVNAAGADEVRLKSGAVLEGQILTEDAYEVKLMVSRNKAGTIKTVKVIDQKEVAALVRNVPNPRIEEEGEAAPGAGETEAAATPKEPDAADLEKMALLQFERLLQQSDGLLAAGEYDTAVQRFKTVANSRRLMQMQMDKGQHALEALEIRVRAHKLWEVAIEGKAEYNEERERHLQQQVKTALKEAEEALDDYKEKQREQEKEKNRITAMKGRTNLGGYRDEEEMLEGRVKEAKQRIRSFESWRKKNAIEIKNLESQGELIDEKVDQLEDDLKLMRKELKRRR